MGGRLAVERELLLELAEDLRGGGEERWTLPRLELPLESRAELFDDLELGRGGGDALESRRELDELELVAEPLLDAGGGLFDSSSGATDLRVFSR